MNIKLEQKSDKSEALKRIQEIWEVFDDALNQVIGGNLCHRQGHHLEATGELTGRDQKVVKNKI